jgi:RNA polymerase I-specific transcription initiation factor RRN6
MMRAKAISQPTTFPRSSPGPMLGGMGSSSQAPSQSRSQSQSQVPSYGSNLIIPQSQVERGKFGGKLDKKKKKKGRISGF